MMEYGQKTMNLLGSPRWPISNRTVAQIWPKNDEPLLEPCSLTHFQLKSCINLRESEFRHKKKEPKRKFRKKKPFRRPKRWNFAKKTINLLWSPTHWPISNRKSCTNLCEYKFRCKKKKHRNKIFKKMPFQRPKWWNLMKNDGPLMESYSSTHFQSKSSTNLHESEFLQKKKAPKQKFSKKCHVRVENDGIWPKNDQPPMESCSLTYF